MLLLGFLSILCVSRRAYAEDACGSSVPAFFLAGDSTTAVQSADGGGWGVGFLATLTKGSWGIDLGHNGATTVSFVEDGYWANVIDAVKSNATTYQPIVSIQFGHNDQKEKYNISLSEYETNLENLATEVKQAGGTPILVTPLSRRSFSSNNTAIDSLHNERLATIRAAIDTNTTYIDLNQASLQYISSIGNESAQAYNLDADDRTHLNSWGSAVFGRMVADLILGHPANITGVDWTPDSDDCLAQYFVQNETMSNKIWGGIAV